MKKLTNKKYLLIIGLLLISLPVIYLGYWLATPYQAQDLAIASLKSTEKVTVNNDDYLLFEPDEKTQSTGIIIYPGGRVEPEAYAVLANQLAQEGYLTSIVPMPLNLAVLNPLGGESVIEENTEIENWIAVGHSLGGSMAARLADENDKVTGLIFLAAYPESGLDISKSNLEVGTTIGSNDGFVSEQEVKESLNQLPKDTLQQIIEGGNHSQFGDYGFQKGDNPATIDYAEQLEQTIMVIKEIDLRISE